MGSCLAKGSVTFRKINTDLQRERGLNLAVKRMWVIEALRVPISYLLLNLVSLNSRYVFREWGDICEEDPTPLFYNMDSFKNASLLGRIFLQKLCWLLVFLPVTTAPAPGDTLIWARTSLLSASASRRGTNQSHKKQLCKICLKQNLNEQMLCSFGPVWATLCPT